MEKGKNILSAVQRPKGTPQTCPHCGGKLETFGNLVLAAREDDKPAPCEPGITTEERLRK